MVILKNLLCIIELETIFYFHENLLIQSGVKLAVFLFLFLGILYAYVDIKKLCH